MSHSRPLLLRYSVCSFKITVNCVLLKILSTGFEPQITCALKQRQCRLCFYHRSYSQGGVIYYYHYYKLVCNNGIWYITLWNIAQQPFNYLPETSHLYNVSVQWGLQPVWPDRAFLQVLNTKLSHKSNPNILVTFWPISNNVNIM